MKDAIIVDLDGTLYNCEARRKQFLTPTKRDFDGFNEAAQHDPPYEWCVRLVQAMDAVGVTVHFISGREDKHRYTTIDWIRKHLAWSDYGKGPDELLLMRRSGDYRPDEDVKRELCFESLTGFKILFVVDDRKKVVDMWRAIGFTALHCAEGDF